MDYCLNQKIIRNIIGDVAADFKRVFLQFLNKIFHVEYCELSESEELKITKKLYEKST